MTRIVFSLPILPSKILLLYLMIIHSVMLVTLLSLFSVSWWSFTTTLVIAVSFIYFYRQSRLIVKIEQDADDGWHCHYRDGSSRSQLTLSSSVVIPQLVILYFNGRKFWQQAYAVTIVADAVDAELFRQLRLYCRDPKTFQQ